MGVSLAVAQVPQRKGKSLPAAFLLSGTISYSVSLSEPYQSRRISIVVNHLKELILNSIPRGKQSDSKPGLDANPAATP